MKNTVDTIGLPRILHKYSATVQHQTKVKLNLDANVQTVSIFSSSGPVSLVVIKISPPAIPMAQLVHIYDPKHSSNVTQIVIMLPISPSPETGTAAASANLVNVCHTKYIHLKIWSHSLSVSKQKSIFSSENLIVC